jgi:hypothetical protein
MNRLTLIIVLAAICFHLSVAVLVAQTPPCDRAVVAVVKAGGSANETRFIPAPPAHVKACVRKALLVVAAKSVEETDTSIVAREDLRLWMERWQQNMAAGAKKRESSPGSQRGTFQIELVPESQDDVKGTRVTIHFKKGFGTDVATPLMEEVACLVRILSPTDPRSTPAGPVNEATKPEHRSVTLPEGTPVKLVLTDILSSTEHPDDPIVFEVSEDVLIGGAVVIRRGALGIGKILAAKASAHWNRGAALEFEVQGVTAADGQVIKVLGRDKKIGGASMDVILGGGLLGGGLTKGQEIHIRAGTGYSVQTVGQYPVEVGQ